MFNIYIYQSILLHLFLLLLIFYQLRSSMSKVPGDQFLYALFFIILMRERKNSSFFYIIIFIYFFPKV